MLDSRVLSDSGPASTHGDYRAFASARVVHADAALRSAEPVPAELAWFLMQRFAGERPGDSAAPVVPLDALLAGGEPLPVGAVLLLLRRIAAMLDAAASVGIVVGTLAPRRVVLDGRHLVLVRDDDPAGVDGAYVAPEQRRAGWSVDARASQYGLAVFAASLLGGVGPAAERVLRVARDPAPDHRFSTAGDFVTALAAACGAWVAAPPGAGVAAAAALPAGRVGSPARPLLVAALVGVAALGVGAGWYAGARPAGAGDRIAFDAAAAATTGRIRDPGVATGSATPGPAALGEKSETSVDRGAIRYDVLSIGEAEGLFRRASDSVATLGAGTHDTPARTRDSAVPTIPRIDGQLRALASGVAIPQPAVANPADLGQRVTAGTSEFAAGALGGISARGGHASAEIGAQQLRGGPQPVYPRFLQEQHVSGEVVARFLVDSTGRVDPSTFELVRSSHPLFTTAVRAALGRLAYLPAEHDGRHVAQTVEQAFRFEPPR